MDVDDGPTRHEVVGHVVVLLVTRDAVAADLDEVGCIVRAAGVDIGPALYEVLDHAQLPAMRRLPQHRPTVRSDTGQPTGPLIEDDANRLLVAPRRGSYPDLQEVGGFSCEPYVGHGVGLYR